jgi:hypothetical protein
VNDAARCVVMSAMQMPNGLNFPKKSGTFRPLREKNRGRIVCPQGDALSRERIVQGTVRPGDGSSRGRIVQGEDRPGDISSGDASYGDGSCGDGSSGYRVKSLKNRNGTVCTVFTS